MVLRDRRLRVAGLDQLAARGRNALVHTGGHAREDRRAERRAFLGGGRAHRQVVHVGHHLPPQRTRSAAAAGQHLAGDNAHPAQDIQAFPLGINHALEHRAKHVVLRMDRGQAEEHAARVRVQLRGTLAHQVRHIDQMVRADRHAGRFLIHQEIRILADAVRRHHFFLAEVVTEPVQRQTGGERAAHDRPAARNGGAERVHAALRVNRHTVGVREHHAGGAECRERLAFLHHAGADSRGGVVARAARHGGAFLQARQCGGFLRHRARHVGGLVHLREQALVNVELFENLAAPAAVRHVEKLHTGSVRNLGGILAGEHVTNVILREQDVAALRVDLRLVVAHPEDLRSRESRQRRVRGDFDQTLRTDLLRDFVALGGGALVTPDDGAAQDAAVFIEHDKAVHLAGNTESAHESRIHAGLIQHRADRVLRGVPPVGGILLGPAVLRLIHGIFDGSGGHGVSVRIKQHRFGAGRAEVNAKQIFESHLVSSFIIRSGFRRTDR